MDLNLVTKRVCYFYRCVHSQTEFIFVYVNVSQKRYVKYFFIRLIKLDNKMIQLFQVSNLIKILMYVYQYHIVGYIVMSFFLLEPSKIYTYYSSLAFSPHIFMIFVHILGLVLLSLNEKKE